MKNRWMSILAKQRLLRHQLHRLLQQVKVNLFKQQHQRKKDELVELEKHQHQQQQQHHRNQAEIMFANCDHVNELKHTMKNLLIRSLFLHLSFIFVFHVLVYVHFCALSLFSLSILVAYYFIIKVNSLTSVWNSMIKKRRVS